jgi:hypothetical protein
VSKFSWYKGDNRRIGAVDYGDSLVSGIRTTPLGSVARCLMEILKDSPPERRRFSLSPGKLSIGCAMSFRATEMLCHVGQVVSTPVGDERERGRPAGYRRYHRNRRYRRRSGGHRQAAGLNYATKASLLLSIRIYARHPTANTRKRSTVMVSRMLRANLLARAACSSSFCILLMVSPSGEISPSTRRYPSSPPLGGSHR